MARVDPARLVAFDVLRAVAEKDAYANLELAQALRAERLGGRDAALATELTSGTLRMQGAYDAILDQLVRGRLDPPVRIVLRLGTHQLLGMRIPDHAAVGATVDLVKKRIGHKPAGLVNAVLRKVAARPLDDWMADQPLHVRHSHPAWVVAELERALGGSDELEALLAADNDRPQVTLVARPGLATLDELGGAAHPASPYAVVLEGGDPGAIGAVREGRAGVQDAGSQRVAIALAEAPLEGRDERWLDVCAGPGGKSALLAAIAAQRGARLLANERAPHRAALVRQAVRATDALVIAGDGTRPAWRPGTFDRVLVDAPCSGLGALRRRPEARWRKQPADLAELVPLQQALLRSALQAVRPGGVVVYATCSPVLAETREVVDAVLADSPDVVEEDAVQLWPHRDGTDAMFWAVLRRR